MASRKRVRLELPEQDIYLFDAAGAFFGNGYDDEEHAHSDAVGPRFFKGFTVAVVKLTKVRSKRYRYQDPYKRLRAPVPEDHRGLRKIARS